MDASTPPAAPRPLRGRQIGVRIGLSLVLAVAFALALRPYLQAVPPNLSIPGWVLPAYGATLVPYHLLRAGRWQFLLQPLGPPRWRTTLAIGLAGYFWIAVLPFRLGELARPIFLAQRSRIPVTSSLATVVIERVVDGLIVCGLFFASTASHPAEDLGAFQVGATVVVGAFTAALVGLLAMAKFPELAARLFHTLLGRIHPRLATWAANTVLGVARGLAALPSPRALLGFVATSLVYWFVNAGGTWLLAYGCGLPLSFGEALAVLAIMNLTLMIPGGPAQFGVFQTGVAFGLGLWLDLDTLREQGSVFTFYLYVVQLGSIALVGGVAQVVLGLDWRAAIGVHRTPMAAGEDPPGDPPGGVAPTETPSREPLAKSETPPQG